MLNSRCLHLFNSSIISLDFPDFIALFIIRFIASSKSQSSSYPHLSDNMSATIFERNEWPLAASFLHALSAGVAERSMPDNLFNRHPDGYFCEGSNRAPSMQRSQISTITLQSLGPKVSIRVPSKVQSPCCTQCSIEFTISASPISPRDRLANKARW